MKNLFKLSVVLVAAALVFTSCNCFKKMAKHREDIQLTCTPEVLELNNGKVTADISVTIPCKYFNAKAIAKVTPVMVFKGGEVAGTPKYYQGSKVNENYTVVEKNAGGVYTQHVEFAYDSRMKESELQLRIEIKCPKGNCKEMTLINANTGAMPTKEEAAILAAGGEQAIALQEKFGLTIALGVNTMQQDLNYANYMASMANDYKKVTTVVDKSEILYAINKSTIGKTALKDSTLDQFQKNVEKTIKEGRGTQHISVSGYASPDGPETFNDKLSKARSESGKEAVAKLLKDSGLNIDAAAYGEDWSGLKEMVESSDIKDKNLILQVLSLYDSSAQRENEIKNMSSVFNELKSNVLPKLRRSQVVNSTDIQGKSEDEMMALVKENKLDQLTNEELLYLADQTKDNATKIALLDYTAKKYDDARAYNNLGVAYANVGDSAASLKAFDKASKMGSTTPQLNNNLALANLANGNVDEAKQYLQAADAKTKGIAAAAQGDYKEAAKHLTGMDAAIANTMNKDYTAAKNAIANDNSAKADYLRSVIATKEGDTKTAEAQLKSAIQKDPKLAEKAAHDVNFKKLSK